MLVKTASMKVLEDVEEDDVAHFHKLGLDAKT